MQELARLQAAVSDGLRRFEFGLRRQLDGEAKDVLLSGSDDVPAEFKSLVEEYYPEPGPAAARTAPVTSRRRAAAAGAALVLLLGVAASAQWGGGWGRMRRVPPRLPTERRQLRWRLQLLPA